MNTTAWVIDTRDSCWKRSFRRSNSDTTCHPIPRCGRSAVPVPEPSARSRRPGSGPTRFGKVYSSVGSFTNIRGGNVYPSLVRKTEPKPIRVYMADTSGDIDNAFGSWPWANQRMASALEYMGYDIRFDWAEGYAHNADYGGSRFPEAMKWLWRSEKHQPGARHPRRSQGRHDTAAPVDSRTSRGRSLRRILALPTHPAATTPVISISRT